jgi:uncharacterized membrane protein YoaK (UPF0700 family)
MTGNVTNGAIALVKTEMIDFLDCALLTLSFTFGAFLTGYLGGNYDNFSIGHSYGRIFLIGALLLTLALISEIVVPKGLTFCFFAAMACGLQNSMTTKFSGNMIRTTHVTGSLTDIGLTLGRMARGHMDGAWKLGLLCPMTLTFFLGGIIGASIYPVFQRSSLIVSIVVFGGTGAVYTFYFSKYFKVSYYKAVFGKTDLFRTNENKERDDYDFKSTVSYFLSNDKATSNQISNPSDSKQQSMIQDSEDLL